MFLYFTYMYFLQEAIIIHFRKNRKSQYSFWQLLIIILNCFDCRLHIIKVNRCTEKEHVSFKPIEKKHAVFQPIEKKLVAC